MKNLRTDDIESTLTALQEEIENRKLQMQQNRMQASVSPMVSQVLEAILSKAGGSYLQVNNAIEHGSAFTRQFIQKVQVNLEEKPWDVLRQVAITSFGIGLFLSLRRKRTSTGAK